MGVKLFGDAEGRMPVKMRNVSLRLISVLVLTVVFVIATAVFTAFEQSHIKFLQFKQSS